MPVNEHQPDDEPIVLDCVLELRVEGDYCRGRVRVEQDERILFDEYVSTLGLIASLRGNSQEPIMTCSCTVPECAGFYEQESWLLPDCVHWSLRYHGDDLDLFFDRNAYETAALSILRHFHDHPWASCDFGTVPDEYANYEDFVRTLDELFDDCPHLAAIWKESSP